MVALGSKPSSCYLSPLSKSIQSLLQGKSATEPYLPLLFEVIGPRLWIFVGFCWEGFVIVGFMSRISPTQEHSIHKRVKMYEGLRIPGDCLKNSL